MQLQTLRDTQVEILRRAFGDQVSVVGDHVLIGLTVDVGSIDVTSVLSKLAAGAYEDLEADHPQDVIDILRVVPFADGVECLDGIEWLDHEARVIEDRLGLDRGALGAHVAG